MAWTLQHEPHELREGQRDYEAIVDVRAVRAPQESRA
jgi:hypothetical protein